jgi:stress-induced morphogen
MGASRLPDASDGPLRLYPGFAKGRTGTIEPVEGVNRLQNLLGEAFPDAQAVDVVDRTGGGDHFHVTVVSGQFEGLSLVEQHKLVYAALAEPFADGTIHELRITTRVEGT